LAVDSVLGQGSRFHFQIRFPVTEMPVSDAPVPVIPALGTLKTLIVDDNAIARDVLRHMVESMGWQADTASDSAEAIARVEACATENTPPYAVIFMDWQMPEIDGWETSQRIRKLTAGAVTPIVVMVTAHGREVLAQRSAAEHALINGFLVKPVTASMLHDAVVEAKAAASAADLGQNPAAPRAAVKPKRLLGLRLLVVEDNKINQMVAKGLLTQEGATVTLADNGQLGFDAVVAEQPAFDAVLMDVQMPVMDGYTATRAIRQELGLTALPIIAMTANAMASDRAACLAAGMNDHVGKPFELDHLVAMLLRITGAPTEPPSAN
jgi:two-component system sensor histidine kinase/response regulator